MEISVKRIKVLDAADSGFYYKKKNINHGTKRFIILTGFTSVSAASRLKC